jgi:hypothetical protein
MSMIVAPEAMNLRTVSVSWVKSVGEWVPPSEKESGVRLRIAMTWVLRVGSVACSDGKAVEIGVVE